MSFNAESLLRQLARFSDLAGPPERYVIAFSGGLDSTVLLHALAASQPSHRVPLLAVHVDHGMQAESASWAEQCAAVAAELGVAFKALRVDVDLTSGQGPEASAREVRYLALRDVLQANDWLLSAHHQDDQAETLLLNLMRGSGPAGLAGIGAMRQFASGWLARPLLDVSRSQLEDYAKQHALQWLEDPSNEQLTLDRNYLRHEVLPRIEQRWPSSASRIRRSAELASEAAQLLSDLADMDLRVLGGQADRLAVDGLRELTPQRQRNVIRHATRRLGLPLPGARHLQSILDDLLPARDDAQPLVSWPGAEVRRYRNELYFVTGNRAKTGAVDARPVTGNRVELGGGLGQLVLTPGASCGLSETVVQAGLELRFRQGGESFQPKGQAHTRKLKKLLQESAVVPWMRECLPLLFSEGQLVAVADLWIAEAASSQPGTAICWTGGPSLY